LDIAAIFLVIFKQGANLSNIIGLSNKRNSVF
ncbi:MAG: hypothetical protein ACI9FY_001263, partial [Patiriisocius sp.]